jgi:hypothetical protein
MQHSGATSSSGHLLLVLVMSHINFFEILESLHGLNQRPFINVKTRRARKFRNVLFSAACHLFSLWLQVLRQVIGDSVDKARFI